MSSWITTSPKKKIVQEPVSFFTYNGGTFQEKTSQATVITAFYDLPSSLSISERKSRLRSFLQAVPCQLILFTQENFAEELASFREGLEDRTKIVVLERNKWTSVNRFIPALWIQQVKQDPELRLGRTAEEFQFAYEKKEFVNKAIEMNPFQSTDFVWVDPLAFSSSQQFLPTFPLVNRIPTDRMLVYNLTPFTADNIASSNFRGKYRVENTILAGSKKSWDQFSKLYDTVMNEKLRLNAFIGDDLIHLHYLIIHKPLQFSLSQESLLQILSE
jgi:hypothetical protein